MDTDRIDITPYTPLAEPRRPLPQHALETFGFDSRLEADLDLWAVFADLLASREGDDRDDEALLERWG